MYLREIAGVIEAASLGTVGVDIFIGTMPVETQAGILLRQFGGEADPELTDIRHCQFQALVRAGDYEAGSQKMESLRQALILRNLTTVTTYFYHVVPLSEPAFVGRDQAGLNQFVIDFDACWR